MLQLWSPGRGVLIIKKITFSKLLLSGASNSVDRHAFCLTSVKIGHFTCKSRSLKRGRRRERWGEQRQCDFLCSLGKLWGRFQVAISIKKGHCGTAGNWGGGFKHCRRTLLGEPLREAVRSHRLNCSSEERMLSLERGMGETNLFLCTCKTVE